MAFCYRVEGIVQGVAFRYHTRKEALRLGIHGSVRNLSDGSVEIFTDSDSGSISRFESYLKSSPGRSEVQKIEKKEVETEINWNDFLIIN